MRKALVILFMLAAAVMAAGGRFGAAETCRSLSPPLINPTGGSYGLNAKVTVSIRAQAGAGIVYTLDGSNPSGGRGGSEIRVDADLVIFTLPDGDVTVKARAVRPDLPPSPVRVAVFTRSSGG